MANLELGHPVRSRRLTHRTDFELNLTRTQQMLFAAGLAALTILGVASLMLVGI